MMCGFATGRGEFGEEQHMDSTQLPIFHFWSLILSYLIKLVQKDSAYHFCGRCSQNCFISSCSSYRRYLRWGLSCIGTTPLGPFRVEAQMGALSWYDLHCHSAGMTCTNRSFRVHCQWSKGALWQPKTDSNARQSIKHVTKANRSNIE